MKGYTVRIGHVDRDNEVVSVICDHGEERLDTRTDTSEALEAVTRLVELRHHGRFKCDCEMVALEDYWVSWSEARALWEEDAVNGTRDRMDDRDKAWHAMVVRVLQTRACPHCDASMLLRIDRDSSEQHMARIHHKDCPNRRSEPTEIFAPFGPTAEGKA